MSATGSSASGTMAQVRMRPGPWMVVIKPASSRTDRCRITGGQAQTRGSGQIRHPRWRFAKPGEDGPAGRIRESVKEQREVGVMLSHVANYRLISPKRKRKLRQDG